ncbi:MAG: thioredoxin domain-containing protein [Planctomycetes bacterium]|nr:thioredoxin domain-containing protein [Planctomycetota bacterium]
MPAPMRWLDWSEDAFAEARARGVPVLLFVRAAWCRFSKELARQVFADPRVVKLVQERFVALQVDKDRRPDLDARYSKGGWPTLAWLDDTGELLAADTYLEADELVARLQLVSDYYAKHRDLIRLRIRELEERRKEEEGAGGPRSPSLSPEIVDHVARVVLENADPQWGGWGREHKFPNTEALDFALIRWSQTGDQAMLQLVRRTLRCMQEGEIHDKVEGGFYRYATQPDWSGPNHEKMLDSNAQRLHVYLEAHQVFGDESYRATAEGILRWMHATLLDPERRVFRGSQDANPAYARLATLEQRTQAGAPPCDPTIFANWNAIAVSSLLKASMVLREPKYREQALATLDFVVEEMFDARRGVHHYWDGIDHLPGLLSDQAYVLRALVDALQYTGESRYFAPAKKLAEWTIENLQSPTGGFYDTPHDPGAYGGLRRRNRSILENAVMAEALLRLASLSREDDFADTARATLESFASDYKRYGHFVAGYARAVDLLFHEPVHVTIVGPRASELVRALAEAALRPYVASRIVQVLDPVQDKELFERSGLPGPRSLFEPARAYVQRGRGSLAETADPNRLPSLMTRVERG